MDKKFDKSLPKIERQMALFMLMYNEQAFHGRKEVFHRGLASNLRMLQRDMKDLTDSGLIKMRYDAKHDQYMGETIQSTNFPINPNTSGRRRQHLLRLHRLCVLLYRLESSDPEIIDNYEADLSYYEIAVEDAIIHPDDYSEEDLIKPEFPQLLDARTCYRELFPECSTKTMQRDFAMLGKFGIEVSYYPKYKVYLVS